MPPLDAVFNANEVIPQQGGGAHPVGNKFQFTITNTIVDKNNNTPGGKFVVEFTSPHGSIKENYNLWNESEAARKISAQELSALCHAVGIYQVDFKNEGAALRGGIGLMDVGFQKGHEPSAEKPAGGFVELKKVYDKNGNEPGKAAQTPQQQTQQQPQGGQVQSGGFDPKPNAAPSGGGNGGGGWGGGAPNGAGGQPNGASGGWQQSGGGSTEKPPWG